MTKFIRKTKAKRKLTKEQEKAYNKMLSEVEALTPLLERYRNDPFISNIQNELTKKVNEIEAQKEVYLNTPIDKIITYNISRSKLLKPMKMRISKSLLQNYIFLKNNMI